VALFNNTTAAGGGGPNDTPKAERADYYDLGMEQEIDDSWTVGLDGFYKASKNLIDEGQFGAPIILTPFNYQHGRQYGGELTVNYTQGAFSAYTNLSYERAVGRNIISSQFQFNPDDLAYSAAGIAVGGRVIHHRQDAPVGQPALRLGPAQGWRHA
jgi:outer membrane receptor protein involved in Fe transport